MAPAAESSNIRAIVRWKESNVYAGEEIECVITFKNVAAKPSKNKEQEEPQAQLANGYPREVRRPSYATSAAHSRRSSVAQSITTSTRVSSANTTKSAKDFPSAGGHRPALSLSVTSGPSRGGPQSAPIAPRAPYSAIQGHGRSLSIMSLGSDHTSQNTVPSHLDNIRRPARSHARSASLQTISRPTPGPYTGPAPPRQPSPLFESATPPTLAEGQNEQLPVRPTRRRPGTVSAGNTPQLNRQSSLKKTSPGTVFTPTFQFPVPHDRVRSPPAQQDRPKLSRNPSSKIRPDQPRSYSPRPPEGWTGALSSLHPISRVMSEESTIATPRTSSEFYSVSNHSDETLTSEIRYQAPLNGRVTASVPSRHVSRTKRSTYADAKPETLMMGYAQTMGYFVLDGGLVNAAPFEEVKRKGVQGGGGVVGVDRAKTGSGMFGAFSWGNLGESLGGLLGAEEKSSIAQMKATAGSKSIPLLATPQNLLFVDLVLAPGESKSFSYRFALPRGLPPTHKGRAIKVSYHLLLGVQRPEGQMVKRIEIPFRILGSYDAHGEGLGHDLMSPYVLLQDVARSHSIASIPSTPSAVPSSLKEPSKVTPKQGLEDFLRYTERLLEHPKGSHDALVSPTVHISPIFSRTRSQAELLPASTKEAVDLAILRANHADNSEKLPQSERPSANRFNIARAGQPVAVLTLLRPAYRLGEAVVGTIDFTAPPPKSGTSSPAPTFSVLIELESAERIDASLALRSSHSIHRVTRRVHAAVRENTLFSRQVSFNLTVPASATPTFETTGVSLNWVLRVEFTTQRQVQGLALETMPAQDDYGMLEELGTDERGTILIAKERLVADTFEIAVPLRIFGVPATDSKSSQSEPVEV